MSIEDLFVAAVRSFASSTMYHNKVMDVNLSSGPGADRRAGMFIAERYALEFLLTRRRDAIIIIKFMINKNKEFLYWVRNYHFSVSSPICAGAKMFLISGIWSSTLWRWIFLRWFFANSSATAKWIPSAYQESTETTLPPFGSSRTRNESLPSHRWASRRFSCFERRLSKLQMIYGVKLFIKSGEIIFQKFPSGKTSAR